MLKTVFIGGLTNGRIVYEYLKSNKHVDLCLSITNPDDFNGARHVVFEDSPAVIKSGSVKGYVEQIAYLKPDIVFVAGWSELIPVEVLSVPSMGVIGFHPSKLPNDRGRSVLAWQIEEGYAETALTMFKYTEYPDGGDILAQERIIIEESDYISDVLDKVDKATYSMMRAYFPLLRQGILKGRKQDLSEGNFRRLRGEFDSAIKWDDTGRNIYNKIRAISHPYPGAFTELDGRSLKVWRAERLDSFPYSHDVSSGSVVATYYDKSLVVKTRDGFIHITDYEIV